MRRMSPQFWATVWQIERRAMVRTSVFGTAVFVSLAFTPAQAGFDVRDYLTVPNIIAAGLFLLHAGGVWQDIRNLKKQYAEIKTEYARQDVMNERHKATQSMMTEVIDEIRGLRRDLLDEARRDSRTA